MRVLLAEPSLPIANAYRKFLDGTAEALVAHSMAEATQVLEAGPPDVLVAAVGAGFDGEALCVRLKALAARTGIVLVYAPEQFEDAPQRAAAAGADAFLVGPVKRHSVLSAMRSASLLAEARARVAQAEGALAAAVAQAAAERERFDEAQRAHAGTQVTDEAFFKRYILLELKRSRRYRYPASVLLVAIDRLETHLAQHPAGDARRAIIRAEVLEVLSSIIRDVDIAMPFSDDRFLLFLPHTPRVGAGVVAGRVVERLKSLSSFPRCTASAGVACFEPAPGAERSQVSFAALVREAGEGLTRAFAAGGNRAELPLAGRERSGRRKTRIVMG